MKSRADIKLPSAISKRIMEDTKKIVIDPSEEIKSHELKRTTRFFQKKKGKLKIRWWDRRKLKKHADESFIITMMFQNGTLKTFVIRTSEKTFKVKKKTYYLFYEETWFDLSMNQYHLFYHENFAVPINREIRQEGDESYFVVTPQNLKPLIEFHYIKTLAGSHSLNKSMKFIIILLVINGIISLAVLFAVFSKGAGA